MVDVPRTMMGLELQAVCHAADVAEPGNKGTTAWQFLDLNQPHCIQTTTLTVQGLDQKPCFFLYYGHCPNTEDVSPGFDDLPEWGDEWEM